MADPSPATGPGGDSIILEEEIDPNYVPSQEEVMEYAKWLGMDLEKDIDMFWIAREGLKAPLPENWKPCKTTDTDEIYYFNFASGESTWDHPCDEYYRNLYEEERKKKVSGEKESSDSKKQQAKQDVKELLGKGEEKSKPGTLKSKKKEGSLGAVSAPGMLSKSSIFDRKPLPNIGGSGDLGSKPGVGPLGSLKKSASPLSPPTKKTKEAPESTSSRESLATDEEKQRAKRKPLSAPPFRGTTAEAAPVVKPKESRSRARDRLSTAISASDSEGGIDSSTEKQRTLTREKPRRAPVYSDDDADHDKSAAALRAAERRKEELEGELERMEGLKEDAERKADSAERAKRKVEASLEETRSELAKVEEEAVEERDKARAELRKAKSSDDLKRKVAELEEELEQARLETAESEKRAGKAKAEVERLKKRMSESEAEVVQLRERVDEEQQRAKDKDKAALEEQRKLKDRLKEAQDGADDLKVTADRSKDEMARLKRTLDRAEAKVVDLEREQDEPTSRSAVSSGAPPASSEPKLREEVARQEEELDELRRAKREAFDKLERGSRLEAELQSEKEELLEEQARLEKRLGESRDAQRAAERSATEARKEAAALREEGSEEEEDEAMRQAVRADVAETALAKLREQGDAQRDDFERQLKEAQGAGPRRAVSSSAPPASSSSAPDTAALKTSEDRAAALEKRALEAERRLEEPSPEVSSLKRKLKHLEEENEDLHNRQRQQGLPPPTDSLDLESAKRRERAATDRLEAMQDEVAKSGAVAAAERRALREDLTKAETLKRASDREVNDLRHQITMVNSELEAERSRLVDNEKDKAQELAHLKEHDKGGASSQEQAATQAKLIEAVEELSRLKRAATLTSSELAALRRAEEAAREDGERLAAEAAEARKQADTSAVESQRHSRELAACKAEAGDLKVQAERAREELLRKQSGSSECSSLKAQLDEARQTAADEAKVLAASKDRLERRAVDLESQLAEREAAEQDLAKTKRSLEGCKAQCEAAEDEAKWLRDRRDLLTAKNRELENDLRDAKSGDNSEALKRRLAAEKASDLKALEEQHEEAMKRVRRLNSDLEEQLREVKSRPPSGEAAAAAVDPASSEEVDRLQRRCRELQRRVEELESERDASKRALDSARRELVEAEDEKRGVRKELEAANLGRRDAERQNKEQNKDDEDRPTQRRPLSQRNNDDEDDDEEDRRQRRRRRRTAASSTASSPADSRWRDRLGIEQDAVGRAKELVKAQREWLRKRRTGLETRRDEWRRSPRASSSNRRSELDGEAEDLNKLLRQLRSIQSWLATRESKLRRAEDVLSGAGSSSGSPSRRRRRPRQQQRSENDDRRRTNYDDDDDDDDDDWDEELEALSSELEDDTRSLSTLLQEQPIPAKRTSSFVVDDDNNGPSRRRGHQRANQQQQQQQGRQQQEQQQQRQGRQEQQPAYFVVQGNQQQVRYAPPFYPAPSYAAPNPPPPPPPPPTQTEEQPAQAPTLNRVWPAPASSLGKDSIKEWSKNRDQARHAVQQHVRWLDNLRSELTGYQYGTGAAQTGTPQELLPATTAGAHQTRRSSLHAQEV